MLQRFFSAVPEHAATVVRALPTEPDRILVMYAIMTVTGADSTGIIALKKVPFEAVDTTIDVEADSALMRGTSVADLRNHWGRPANASLVTSADIPAAHHEFDRALRALSARVALGE